MLYICGFAEWCGCIWFGIWSMIIRVRYGKGYLVSIEVTWFVFLFLDIFLFIHFIYHNILHYIILYHIILYYIILYYIILYYIILYYIILYYIILYYIILYYIILYGWWLLEEGTSRNVPIAGFENPKILGTFREVPDNKVAICYIVWLPIALPSFCITCRNFLSVFFLLAQRGFS